MNAYLLGQQKRRTSGTSAYLALRRSGCRAQVIPALLAGLALGFDETRLKRIVPDISTVEMGIVFVDTGRYSLTPLSAPLVL